MLCVAAIVIDVDAGGNGLVGVEIAFVFRAVAGHGQVS